MRLFSVFFSLMFMTACSTSNQMKFSKTDASECPEGGVCKFEIFKNKSLAVKEDGIGQLYYDLVENKNTSVYVYTYFVAGPENTEDGNLTEKIIFELDNIQSENLSLENESLQKVNMLFSRACFCRGQMGTFRVEKGFLKITENSISAEAKTSKVPQTLTNFTLR
ncbi:MAG: hypothetical protein ACOVLC_07065 [Flavobacterium sp.]